MGNCAIAQALTDGVNGGITNVNVGDAVTFTLTGAPAFTAATQVTVTNVLPAGLTFVSSTASVGSYDSAANVWNVGTLNGASAITLTITATVNTGTEGQTIATLPTINFVQSNCTQSSAVAGNTITVNGAVITTPTSTPTSTQTSTVNYADLSVTKTADVTSTVEGGTINYTIAVTDNGPATSTGVVATDTLPAGLTFVSATTSEGSYASSTGTWNIGDMSASSTATLTIAATVNAGEAGDTITNTGLVGENSTETDPNLTNNSSSVSLTVQSPSTGGTGGTGCTSNCGGGGGGGGGGSVPTADVSIVKTVDNASPSTGGTINYTLTVSDAGPYASNGVVATDVLPSGLSFVSATTSEGSYASSTGTWNVGSVVVGSNVTLVITASVNASAGTQITNTASVTESAATVDPNLANNSSSVTLTVAGGGGGGGGGSIVTGGSGGGGGAVLGASTSTGQVLGASCGLYLDQYIHPIRKYLNDPTEVDKLQVFLNMDLGDNLAITGDYNNSTIQAVDQFQVKYYNEVLSPWVPLGLPTQFTPTDYVYQTTQRWINLIMCPPLNLPMPTLHVDNGVNP